MDIFQKSEKLYQAIKSNFIGDFPTMNAFITSAISFMYDANGMGDDYIIEQLKEEAPWLDEELITWDNFVRVQRYIKNVIVEEYMKEHGWKRPKDTYLDIWEQDFEPKEDHQHETDIEIVEGNFTENNLVMVRVHDEQRRRKVYADHTRNELYIMWKGERYYKSEFDSSGNQSGNE